MVTAPLANPQTMDELNIGLKLGQLQDGNGNAANVSDIVALVNTPTPTGRTVRVVTFGDSTATFINPGTQSADGGTTWNGDTSQFSINTFPGSGATSAITGFEKMTLPLYYPRAYIVGNGGISGQTLTQMLARDTLGASITRMAITDVLNYSPDVVLYRGGSINDVQGLTAASNQAQIDTIYANHNLVVDRLLMGDAIVIDEGIQGWQTPTTTTTPDMIFQRNALVQLNQRWKANAVNRPPRYKFIDLSGITYIPFGQVNAGSYLQGKSYDGTHLGTAGAMVLGKLEANLFTQMFGVSTPYRYDGINLATNPVFGNISTGIPTGVTWTNNNTTIANRNTISRNGTTWAVCEFTATAPNGSGGVILDNLIYTGGGIVVTSGEAIGYEMDVFIENLSGGAPPLLSSWVPRVDLNNGTGRFIASPLLASGTPVTAFDTPEYWHYTWNQIIMPANSAGMTSATAWNFNFFLANSGDAFRMGVTRPRLTKIT